MKRKDYVNAIGRCKAPYVAEPLNIQLRRAYATGTGITSTVTPSYAETEDLNPATNIRTDKWDVVMEVSDKVEKWQAARGTAAPEIKGAPEGEE